MRFVVYHSILTLEASTKQKGTHEVRNILKTKPAL